MLSGISSDSLWLQCQQHTRLIAREGDLECHANHMLVIEHSLYRFAGEREVDVISSRVEVTGD